MAEMGSWDRGRGSPRGCHGTESAGGALRAWTSGKPYKFSVSMAPMSMARDLLMHHMSFVRPIQSLFVLQEFPVYFTQENEELFLNLYSLLP